QEEDFGIVAVEAQAAGRPVIAFKKGGATETVVDNKTGIFFAAQTVDSMAASVKRFNSLKFNAAAIKSQAENFNYDTFAKNLKRQVKSLWKNHH
ncbi:TPA: glycosyltransferase family 4 protein, partial [Candidatus Beckwithbacteria bacterium]|nr:glycosyltransferase family 4 protein [Candidatus Beckwithbacteria bacterium]